MTRGLILACLLVQLALELIGPGAASGVIARAALVPARLTGAVHGYPDSVPAVLTLATSIFLHAGWMHLVLNLVFLGLIGRHVEWLIGSRRFLALFLLGGVAGSLAQVALSPSLHEPVVGASGAVSAVFGSYALLFARRQATSRRLAGRAIPSELAAAMRLAVAWLAIQLLTGLVASLSGFSIAVGAHIGGFLAGLAWAGLLTRRRPA